MAVFNSVGDSVCSAVAIQKNLKSQDWNETGALHVRIGLHTGEVEERDGDIFGTTINKASRIMSMASAGQILISDLTTALLNEHPQEEISFIELGNYHLRGLPGQTKLFQLNHPELAHDFHPLSGSNEVPNNLPANLASFIGRQKELAQITNLLVDTAEHTQRIRLVTLAGPGGTGKTRLSVEAGKMMRQAFPDGVWIVELAPLSEPEKILMLSQKFSTFKRPPGLRCEKC